VSSPLLSQLIYRRTVVYTSEGRLGHGHRMPRASQEALGVVGKPGQKDDLDSQRCQRSWRDAPSGVCNATTIDFFFDGLNLFEGFQMNFLKFSQFCLIGSQFRQNIFNYWISGWIKPRQIYLSNTSIAECLLYPAGIGSP
jgi:hypothetical protein